MQSPVRNPVNIEGFFLYSLWGIAIIGYDVAGAARGTPEHMAVLIFCWAYKVYP